MQVDFSLLALSALLLLVSKKFVSASTQAAKPDEEERVPQGDCVVCGRLAKSFCSGCKHIFYCTRDHQKQDWKNHKEDCKAFMKIPYRVF